MLQIVVQLNHAMVGKYEFDQDRITIGRTAENDLRVDNMAVSRLHAVIEKDCGSYYIVDQGSTNGTFVCGERVTRKALNHRDAIAVGKHTLVIGLPHPTEQRGLWNGRASGTGPSATDLDRTTMCLDTPHHREPPKKRTARRRG